MHKQNETEINTDSTALFRATFGDHISDSPHLLHRISRNIVGARNIIGARNVNIVGVHNTSSKNRFAL